MSGKTDAEDKQNVLQAELIKKMDSSKFTAHKLSVQDAEKHYTTSLTKGLTQAEVEKRQKEHGLNELDKEEDKTLWERIMEQFEDTLV
jgi:magnesium-transporting ATPase (P-type)